MIDIKDILEKAYTYLQSGKHLDAKKQYEKIINLLPEQSIGYIGKSVSMACDSSGCSYDELFCPILLCKNKKIPLEYAENFKLLIDYKTGEYGTTLLMHACAAKQFNVVQILIDLGADINITSHYNTTALWYVAFKKLPNDKISDGRKIAKKLIDMGAAVDVVNKGGVALYNNQTDKEIAKMIKEKHPKTDAGECAGDTKQTNLLNIIFGGILAFGGFVWAFITGKSFIGTICCIILFGIGYYLGEQINKIRTFGRSVAKKSIKIIVLLMMILTALVLLLSRCNNDDSTIYRTCPNCGTKMEAKYVDDDSCTRCDGRDWS